MSYGKDKTDPGGGWEELAEWTGGLPPDQIRALTAVRSLEAVHSLLRGLAGRTPRELLARAAVLEALASPEPDFEGALAWLTGPVRGEILSALDRGGWLEPGPGGTFVLTALGRRVWDSMRYAGSPGTAPASPLLPALPAGATPDRIVQALLSLGLKELAEAGRDALVPVLQSFPLLSTDAVARAAEAQARSGNAENAGRAGERKPAGKPGGKRPR
ncbi:MAG: hypothetical protein ABUT39_18070 [Acidobacteriota bacterium]